MNYLIAYDIAHPRRLRRVARFLERRALRCQKSVFLFRGDADSVIQLLDEVTPLLDRQQDIIQAWKLSKDQPTRGLTRGTPAALDPACAVVFAGQAVFVEKRKS